MAVDRADVVEAQLFEQGAAGGVGPGEAFPALGGGLDRAGEPLGDVLGDVAQAVIGAAGRQAGEVGRHGTDWRGDAHVVVVEDHGQPPAPDRRVVHRLVGHVRRHGAVADLEAITCTVLGDHRAGSCRRPCPVRQRSRSMNGRCRRRRIALPAHEARQPVFLAQAADTVAAFGQDFVRVGLVSHVPDQPVVGGVEDPVQRDGQLDHAQTGTQGHKSVRLTASISSARSSSTTGRQRLVGQRTQTSGRWIWSSVGVWVWDYQPSTDSTRCKTGNRPGFTLQLRTGIGLNGGGLAQIPPEKTGMPVPHHCH